MILIDLRDRLHERKIQRLAAATDAAFRSGDALAARATWNALREAVMARSPEQVARMEERLKRAGGQG